MKQKELTKLLMATVLMGIFMGNHASAGGTVGNDHSCISTKKILDSKIVDLRNQFGQLKIELEYIFWNCLDEKSRESISVLIQALDPELEGIDYLLVGVESHGNFYDSSTNPVQRTTGHMGSLLNICNNNNGTVFSCARFILSNNDTSIADIKTNLYRVVVAGDAIPSTELNGTLLNSRLVRSQLRENL